ncbi:MAG: tetratricopeptide repeat protein [Planctomycetota bacterium]
MLAVWVGYFDTLSYGFVFDDSLIVDNEGLRSGSLWQAVFGGLTPCTNRPLTAIAYWYEVAHGASPSTMHAVNVALHALACIMVVWAGSTVLCLVRPKWNADRCWLLAGMLGVLWAIHPINVEAVAYIAQRSALLLGLASWSTLLAVCKWRTAGTTAWAVASIAGCWAAMAIKEEGFALPILMLLAAVMVPAPRPSTIPPAAVYCGWFASWSVILACIMLGPANPTIGYHTVPECSAWQWLMTQANAVSHYLWNLWIPSDLRGVYDQAIVRDLRDAWLPGLAVLAVMIAGVFAWRRAPAVGLAVCWWFLFLAPTSTIVPIVSEPIADRRVYVAGVGLWLALFAWVAPRCRTWTLVAAWAALVVVFVVTTRHVAAAYRDEATFWNSAGAANALSNGSFMSGRILSSWARHLYQAGDKQRSFALLERAAAAEALGQHELLNIANMRREQGRTREAEAMLRKVVAHYPDYAEGHGNLALLVLDRAAPNAEARAGDLREAERLLRTAVGLAPRSAELNNSLAVCLHTLGATAEAVTFLQRALELAPDYVEAGRNLVIARLALGDAPAAFKTLDEMIARRPGDRDLLAWRESLRR